MKLDRNISADGRGKYGLIKNRRLAEIAKAGGEEDVVVRAAIACLERAGVIDWGAAPEKAFFVLRLRDLFAAGTLARYADEAAIYDMEYGQEVMELARASENMPHKLRKMPD